RLQLEFDCSSPEIDETAHPGEQPEQLVRRLALEKARALGQTHQQHLIIGSDQIAVFGEEILGK
ncbi:MAG TPA: septum formation inhibitor Maf, partial [Pseudomonas sp.]|nr:septum formation inhibitor Maf [Pseudomonas sp.]